MDAKENSISEVVLKRFGSKGNHSFKQLIMDFSSREFDLFVHFLALTCFFSCGFLRQEHVLARNVR